MKKRASLFSAKTFAIILSVLILQACVSGSESSTTDSDTAATNPDFQISLAQWSLHKRHFGHFFGSTAFTTA